MESPNREEIDAFMSIAGISRASATQKLQEHGGNLNEAINAHFSEEDTNRTRQTSITAVTAPADDAMDIDDSFQSETRRPPFSLLSSTGNVNPFSLLDPSFTRSIFSGTDFTSREPFVSHPRQVREIPIEVKDGTDRAGQSGSAPTIEDVTGSVHAHGPQIQGTVTMDDDDDEDVSTAQITHGSTSQSRRSATHVDDFPDHSNDIEEQMIRAAIEASKRDAEMSNKYHDTQRDPMPQQRQHEAEDIEMAHAALLSLKTAEQEKTLHDLDGKLGEPKLLSTKLVEEEELRKILSSNGRLEAGSSSVQDHDEEWQPLVRQRRRRMSSGSVEAAEDIGQVVVSPPASPRRGNHNTQQNGRDFHSDQWGGISSEEHDEAVMLEAAMFGGIPEGTGYDFPYAQHQFLQNGIDGNVGHYSRQIPRPPSPSLTAQRLLREQQDDEYFASLQADKEKELRAKEEAEAALAEERRKREELKKKVEEEQEIERQLAAKEASLPQEPASDDEHAVTLLVRMPDGSRRGRRFLKSDKLQYLFDFIDIGRVVKPGTYKVVRPYPRRAFSNGESALTLNELGLTNKQEALFLEAV